MVVIGQSGCIRTKVVAFGQKWLYSDKSGFIQAKVVVFGKSGCIRAKKVVCWQSGFIRVKVVLFGRK